MRKLLIAFGVLALVGLTVVLFPRGDSVTAAPDIIDFETPSLGAADNMIIDPYVDAGTGVSFTAVPGAFGDEVVGLVKNEATSACVDPPDENQKLGTGRRSLDDASIGFGGDAILAAFPKEIPGPLTVSVEYQTASGEPIRLRLFDGAGAEVAAITADAVPPDGTCGFPGSPRARTTLSVTSDKPVASAIMDVPSGCCVFVIDDFEFFSDEVTEGLDHFKCYSTESRILNANVFLTDQFGETNARVFGARLFCNPVEKIHDDVVTPIQNPDAHLLMYLMRTEVGTPRRQVVISNQFGKEQIMEVSRSFLLAVPTQKDRHEPPVGLDHFECYRVTGKSAATTVDLNDQFHEDRLVNVLEPIQLCNPVEKIHNEIVTPIENREDHLVCYAIGASPIDDRVVRTNNQFGSATLRMGEARQLCVPSQKVSLPDERDPNIQTMCGDRPVGDFDGGITFPGGPGTGLYRDNPSVLWPDGQPRRPCGKFVPIDGFLPAGLIRFRLAFRDVADPVPAVGTAAGIRTDWHLYDRSANPWCEVNAGNILSTDVDGWMDASDYEEAKIGGPSTDFCANSGLRLAVWDSDNVFGLGPADKDGHYVLWLEWEDGGGMHREPVEHHLQLDNTLPVINDMLVTLQDGVTPLGACGDATPGESLFRVNADFADDFYSSYRLQVRGGDPPATQTYGWHNYFDGTAEVANTDTTGTVPDATTVFLRNIDMNDLGVSFTDCCYMLDLWVRDAAVRHSFNHRVANDISGSSIFLANEFFTFSAAP